MRSILNRIGDFFRFISNKIAAFFKAVGRLAKHHKKLTALILVVAIIGSAALVLWLRAKNTGNSAGFSRPETTSLQKMDLELTVTATGTLESADKKSVTSSLAYDVEEIYAKVGDVVAAGDLLCTLDPTDLNEKIADVRNQISSAEEQSTKSLTRLADNFTDAKALREENWVKNNNAVQTAQAALTSAQSKETEAQTKYQQSESQKAGDTGLKTAQETMNTKQAELQTAQNAFVASPTSENQLVVTLAQSAYDMAKTQFDSLNASYDAAASAYKEASAAVQSAQSSYNNSVSTRDTAYSADTKTLETALQNYQDQEDIDSAETLREQLADYLEEKEELSITAPISGTITAMGAEVGSSAAGSGASGTASTSGSTSSNALFTIQNTEKLEVPVSVAEYDAVGITSGMPATLTSDAFEDASWAGTVSSISPTASSGYFTVTVDITSAVDKLAIGMSVTVDIITESRQDVYAVPYDAIVTNSSGQSVVYALETSFGNMPSTTDAANSLGTFTPPSFDQGAANQNNADTSGSNRKEIVVETGLETDYYIEISGAELSDGLQILSDPLGNNVQTAASAGSTGNILESFGGGQGGMPGGDIPTGGQGDMPTGGPAGVPS